MDENANEENMYKLVFLTALLLETLTCDANALVIRGTHNNWQNQEMQCSYRYGLNCRTVVTFSDEAEFKFDSEGDWSENFGSISSEECLQGPDCTGRLYRNGENIRLQPNKSYLVSAQIWGESYFSIEEIEKIDFSLPEGNNIKKLFLVSSSAGYGSKAASIEAIVRNTAANVQVGIRYRFNDDEEWTYREGQFTRKFDEATEIWTIQFSGYGDAEYQIFSEDFDENGRIIQVHWDAKTYNTTEDY